MNEPGSRVQIWGGPAVSIYALSIFAGAIGVAYLAKDATTLTILLGIAGANATTVVSYWLGSSAGSAHKDTLIAGRSSSSTTTTTIEPGAATTTTQPGPTTPA
jgi:hypothetical protein